MKRETFQENNTRWKGKSHRKENLAKIKNSLIFFKAYAQKSTKNK